MIKFVFISLFLYIKGSNGDITREASVICEKMRNDLKLFRLLKIRYPGALKLVRYEDYILDVNGTLNEMYNHFHETPPSVVYQSLINFMYANDGKDGGTLSQKRKNAKISLVKWAHSNTPEEIQGMTKNCIDVLEALGYPTDVNSTLLRY